MSFSTGSRLPQAPTPPRQASGAEAVASTPQSLTRIPSLHGTPQRSSGGGSFNGQSSHKLLRDRTSVSSMPGTQDTPTSRPTRPDVEQERVKVCLRIRGALRDDEHPGAVQVDADGKAVTLLRPDAPIAQADFKFDRVLGPGASQHDVYTSGVKDVVDDVLNGYNGTVMAYGMTGAGKTYTLGNTEPSAIGMIPRCVAEIFKTADADPFHNYTITMSYIQIYMELIQDLLRPESENLVIREDLGTGVFIAGVREVQVTSLEECLLYLEQGDKNRTFAFTHLNAHSSRSHAVVMVTVVKSRKYLTAQEKAEVKKTEKDGMVSQKVKVGKLFLVDLAGSERLKKSGSTGQRASEARSINLSLTTLGMCISARATDEKHVPFRDSKLTRLLQESLGGNAKTTLILCVADVKEHVDESLQSLNFGARAMCVKNKPVVNERVDYRLLHAELLSQMDKEADQAHELEVTILRTEEERDKLAAAMEADKEHFEAILAALRSESEQRVAVVSSQLADVQQVADQEAALRTQLETRLAHAQEESAQLAQRHYSQVAELTAQVKELQASKQAAAEEAERKATEAAAQLDSTQRSLEQAKAKGSALQEENAALKAELAALKAAQAHAHSSLAQLQQALKASLPSSLPSLPPNVALSVPKPPAPEPAPAPAPSSGGRQSWTGTARVVRGGVLLPKSRSGPPATSAASAASTPAAAAAPAAETGAKGGQAGKEEPVAAPTPSGSTQDADTTSAAGSGRSSRSGGAQEGPAEVVSPATALVNLQLSGLLQQLAPQVAHAMATLQAHIQVQSGSIKELEGSTASKQRSIDSLSQQVAKLGKELEGVQGQLGAEKKQTAELRARVGELLALMAQQEDTLGQRQHKLAQLSSQLGNTQQQLLSSQEALAAEQQEHADLRAAHAQLQQLNDKLHGIRREARAEALRSKGRDRAARTIQRAYRGWVAARFKCKADKDLQALTELEAARQEATAVAHLQLAQLGSGMMLDSMTVIREAVEALLVTFVGTRKELEHRDKLAARVASAAPLISQARLNTAAVAQRAASFVSLNGAVTPSGASLAPGSHPAGLRAPPSPAMSAFGSMGGSSGRIGMGMFMGRRGPAADGRPPMGPSSPAGPMALPRALTLATTYSAVAPPPLEFTQGGGPGQQVWRPSGTSMFGGSQRRITAGSMGPAGGAGSEHEPHPPSASLGGGACRPHGQGPPAPAGDTARLHVGLGMRAAGAGAQGVGKQQQGNLGMPAHLGEGVVHGDQGALGPLASALASKRGTPPTSAGARSGPGRQDGAVVAGYAAMGVSPLKSGGSGAKRGGMEVPHVVDVAPRDTGRNLVRVGGGYKPAAGVGAGAAGLGVAPDYMIGTGVACVQQQLPQEEEGGVAGAARALLVGGGHKHKVAAPLP